MKQRLVSEDDIPVVVSLACIALFIYFIASHISLHG
jgi:hypothetical protein